MATHIVSHLYVAHKVLKYIKSSWGKTLFFSISSLLNFKAFCNFDAETPDAYSLDIVYF